MTPTGGPARCTCGVSAVGTCSRCANPFCETHNYGRQYNLCSPCGHVATDESVAAFAKALSEQKPWEDVVAKLAEKLIAAAPSEAVDVYRIEVEWRRWPRKRMSENLVKVGCAWPLDEQEVQAVGEKDRVVFELCRMELLPSGKLAVFRDDRWAYIEYLGGSRSAFRSLDPVRDVLNEDAERFGIT